MRKTNLALLSIVSAIGLQGCKLGVGADEYGCTGLPKGTRCMSARDVYDGKQPGGTDETVAQTGNPFLGRDRWPEAPWSNAPTIDAPEPVREPPKVMRIYVFPYEDAKGDLHMPGYVYSEIEPRRWYITDYAKNRAGDGTGAVFPLDVRQQARTATTGAPVQSGSVSP